MRRVIVSTVLAGLCIAIPGAACAQPSEDEPLPAGRVRLIVDTGGHVTMPVRLGFTPDGTRLISTAADRTVQVWDTASGRRLRVIRPPLASSEFGAGNNLTVDAQGRVAAFTTAGKDASGTDVSFIFGCAIDTGETRFVAGGAGVLAFAPNGKLLALTTSRRVRLIVTANGNDRVRGAEVLPETAGGGLRDITFSPDNKALAVVASDNLVRLLRVPSLEAEQTFAAEADTRLLHVAWANAGTLLTVGTPDTQALRVWDARTGKLRKSYALGEVLALLPKGSKPSVHGLTVLAGTKVMLAVTIGLEGGPHNAPVVFDWQSGRPAPAELHPGSHGGRTVAVSNDLSLSAHARRDGVIVLRDRQTGKETLLRGVAGGAAARGACWRPDGTAIAWADYTEGEFPKKGAAPLRAELDLTTLTLRTPPPAELAKYEPGLLRTWGPLSVKIVDKGVAVAVTGGAAPAEYRGRTAINPAALTFVDAGRFTVNHSGTPYLLLHDATGKLVSRARLAQGALGSVALAPGTKHRYLLAGSADRTLTVYNPATDQVLLNVFPAGADWIAWTPQGYYAATPGGERLMGWHVDNGPKQLASFYPAERFRKKLYRPDVIRLLLEKGSVAEALKAADAALEQPTQPAELEKLLPPEAVTLVVLDDSASPVLKLRATAKPRVPQQPIRALRLLVDGRPLPEGLGLKTFAGEAGQAVAEWEITLPEGTHQLAALARTTDASAVSAPVERTNLKPAKQATLHVIAVGVGAYAQPIPPLEHAARDAHAIAKALAARPGGPYRAGLFRTLADDAARKQAVLDAFAELRATAKPNDLVVFYFAGRGARDKGGAYLLTADAKPADLPGTALSGAELRKALGAGEIPCQVLVVLDARPAGVPGQEARSVVDDLARTLTDDECGVAVLSAAMGHEQAQEEAGQSLFTRALVEALTAGDSVPHNRYDRCVYVHHLHSYVFDEVSRRSQQRQHPFLSLPWVVESFPVRRVAKQ